MKKILHHHIHKTGGTSFNSMLDAAYGDDSPCTETIKSYIGGNKDASLNGYDGLYQNYKCIHGHQLFLNTVPDDWFKVVFLRDPIDRVMSLYYDWCSLTDQDINPKDLIQSYKIAARDTPLHNLINLELPTNTIYHGHDPAYGDTNIINTEGNSPWLNHYNRVCMLLHNGMCKSLIRHKFNLKQMYGLSVESILSEAIDVINEFEYVGRTETLDNDVKIIFKHLEIPVPTIPTLNGRGDKYHRIKKLGREIFPVDRSVISQFNQADIKLYDYATKYIMGFD